MKKQKNNSIYFVLIFLILIFLFASIFLIKQPEILYKVQNVFLNIQNEYQIKELDNANLISYQLENTNWQVDQSLILINNEHPLPESFSPSLAEYKDSTVFMNKALLADYATLTEAVTEHTGEKMYVASVYRSLEEQAQLHTNNPDIAQPAGHSEHHTGLALDVYVQNFGGINFIDSKAGQFVDKHCAEFGFIIRYPENKEEITGISYEPWHIRYVGLPHSMIMAKNYWVLEEYINFLEPNKIYKANDFFISRQDPSQPILLPENIAETRYSYDNTGYIIITAKINN